MLQDEWRAAYARVRIVNRDREGDFTYIRCEDGLPHLVGPFGIHNVQHPRTIMALGTEKDPIHLEKHVSGRYPLRYTHYAGGQRSLRLMDLEAARQARLKSTIRLP